MDNIWVIEGSWLLGNTSLQLISRVDMGFYIGTP